MLLSLYHYRQYIIRNALSDLRHRYTGTGLGVFWHVASPLMQIVVYAVVFSQMMKQNLPGDASSMRFVLYLCSGLLPWIAFSECVTTGMNSFLENATYLKKLPIPEQVFVARSAMAATFSLAISLALLLLLAALIQPPRWLWLLVPLVGLLWQALGFGLGLLLGTLNAFIRDIAPIVNLLFQIWLWTLPIIYLANILPSFMQYLFLLNPPYPFLLAIHDLLVFNHFPPLWVWPAMLAWTGAAIALGLLVLRALRAEIRDVI